MIEIILFSHVNQHMSLQMECLRFCNFRLNFWNLSFCSHIFLWPNISRGVDIEVFVTRAEGRNWKQSNSTWEPTRFETFLKHFICTFPRITPPNVCNFDFFPTWLCWIGGWMFNWIFLDRLNCSILLLQYNWQDSVNIPLYTPNNCSVLLQYRSGTTIAVFIR